MLGPVLDLLLDAVDMAMTVLVVLALWDGRKPEVRSRIAGWLAGPPRRGPSQLARCRSEARRATTALPVACHPTRLRWRRGSGQHWWPCARRMT